MADPRKVAVEALRKVHADGAYSNLILHTMLQRAQLSGQDKRFASALFYGVLDRQLTLDYWLDSLMKQPFFKTAPLTAEILRVGLYQIKFLDRIPDSAAINEAVELVKSSKERYNAGFVNAVLRAATRTDLSLPEGNAPEVLAVRYSCPAPIVKTFLTDYGFDDTIGLLEASLTPPPVTLRVNTLRTTPQKLIEALKAEGIEATQADPSGALILQAGCDIAASKRYEAGAFHAQDRASQYCVEALGLEPGQRVLDLCAAPGGKSFTAAQYLQNRGEIIACDVHEHRVSLIAAGAKRLGLTVVRPQCRDSAVYDPALGTFDRVLCDVPCSGLGVLRRKPELKYQPDLLAGDLPERQLQLLKTAAKYLRPEGRLVYSTCTLHRAENEAVVEAFLASHPDFALRRQRTFMPHRDLTDGFFFAVLEQKR